MKEYIKKFKTTTSADGYVIADIPFTSTIGETFINLVCNEPNKKLAVEGDEIVVTNNKPKSYLHLSGGKTIEIEGDIIKRSMVSTWQYSILEVEIGEGVIEIEGGAFDYFTNITTVSFPQSLKIIGGTAFQRCYKLKNITIPSGVETIGWAAFYECKALGNVVIEGNNLKTISQDSFRKSAVSSINIPSSVTTIGNNAFYACNSLPIVDGIRYADTFISSVYDKTKTTYNIKEGTKWIGEGSFSSCTNMTSIVIPDSIIELRSDTFKSCTKLASVHLPNSLKTIGGNVFQGCSALTSITIPNSVTTIGDGSFSDCTNLQNITLSTSITEIWKNAFKNCTHLTSVVIPNYVTMINTGAFYGCSALTSVVVSNSVTKVGTYGYSIGGDYPFTQCTSLPVVNGIRYADTICLGVVDKTLTTYTLKQDTKFIGAYAFSGCSNLTSITIPNSVIDISWYCFNLCSNLTSITIPNSVTNIDYGGFRECSSLKSIEIPDSVINIKEYAFSGCTNLSNLRIGSGVTLSKGTFENCSNLSTIVIDSKNKKYDSRNNSNAIIESETNTIIIGSNNTIIPNTVTSIGDNAFKNCSGLTSIEIPNSVTSIGWSAFKGCSGLTSIEIPNSVASIGENAFQGCSGLTSITIPSSITSIQSSTFANCTSLTSVEVPNSINFVGDSAFSGCTSLPVINGLRYADTVLAEVIDTSSTSFSIKNGTKFISCMFPSTLQYVTIPNSVIDIDTDAFNAGTGYDSVYPGSLQTITVGEQVYNYNEEESFTITLGNGTQVTLTMWYSIPCFLPGTQITLADNTTKVVEELTYDDVLKVWNSDEGNYDIANICYLAKCGISDHYYKVTFSDSTILKVTGKNANHHVYSTDEQKFIGVATMEIGTHVFTENGIVTVTNKEYIVKECVFYNIITSQHFDCFANGVLTSYGFENLYQRDSNMKFIKDERPIRPYSEFEAVGISRYWYDNLRLAEVTDSLESIVKKVRKWELTMQPRS